MTNSARHIDTDDRDRHQRLIQRLAIGGAAVLVLVVVGVFTVVFREAARQPVRPVSDPQVVAAANEHARATGQPREVAMEEVRRYAREIVPTFNAYVYFRVGYSIARAVARFLYRVRLGFADERTLAGVAPGTTVVFVMNHRSNMDYVLVAFLAAAAGGL